MDDKPIRVLLIEDNPGDARLIQEHLREISTAQFELAQVEQLAAGLKRLGQEVFDVLLLDLGLPDSQGLDTLSKTQSQAPDLPIVLLTGLDDEAFALEAVKAGAQDYLVKGYVDEYSLPRAIRYAIERKRVDEERQQLEEQYLQAQKMEAVGRLTGGIAHDFNNLLTAIIGFAELMQMRLPSDDPYQKMVGQILQSGHRASDLVRQLLAFSRKQIIQPTVLDLNVVVAEMGKMLRRIIGEHIQITTDLTPDLWPVKVDPTQIEQVIINLAVNARDAMPEGGRLTIETANVVLNEGYIAGHLETQPGEHVLLTVTDTGIGMSDDVKDHIFEPFFTTKESGQGTGLGLATVFGIVKQSDGYIWVYSEEGQGTTFKIFLPRTDDTAQSSIHSQSERQMPTGNETILLVEDDANVRELAGQVLQEQGYTVLEAQDGQEALQLAARYADSIHLLLTDVIMPGMGGKALAEQLTETRSGLKMLYMSGYADGAIVHHGVLSPGVVLLPKPFSPTDLVRKVRAVLDS